MTNYLSAARTLDTLMLALMAAGAAVPAHVAEDLRTGRSLGSILRRQPDDADSEAKARAALERAEMNLLALAETDLGREDAEAWQRKVNAAYAEPAAPDSAAAKYITGVPKGSHWIRLQAEYLAKAGDELPARYGLKAIRQEDGYQLLYGEKADVAAFLNEIKQRIKEQEAAGGKSFSQSGSQVQTQD